jgi:putative redox protein
MRAIARRAGADPYTHQVEIRQHRVTADEPAEQGGRDEGPTPQELLAGSLAACTAITLEMYAQRKGWDVRQAEVECRYEQPERGAPTRFELVLRLPSDLTEDQRERLRAIAAKCPVHRVLEGEVAFYDRVEVISTPA